MTVTDPAATREEGRLDIERSQGVLVVKVSGEWRLGAPGLSAASEIETEFDKTPSVGEVIVRTGELGYWDSSLLTFLIRMEGLCSQRGATFSQEGLPQGVQRLLKLASAVPERKGPHGGPPGMPFLARVGGLSLGLFRSWKETSSFVGDIFLSLLKMVAGKARFRRSDLWRTIQECGADALPIVSLISILVGLILAFVGSIQLRMFGAQIYIADLVGIAMTRAMGAIMTGIIMAGRTGASFAARIGTMQVNEEIDALKTAGISPMEFLVLPRILALAIMMPLLTLYADLMGILGGLIVSVGGFDISLREYFNETKSAVTLTNVWIGLISSFVFGILIAIAGCMRGMQCGRSASAVGDATTSAVVTGIVSIIIATAIITVLCNMIGI